MIFTVGVWGFEKLLGICFAMECMFSIKYRPKYAKNIIGLLEDGTVQSNHFMQYATNIIHRDAFEKISSNDNSVCTFTFCFYRFE